MSAAAAQAVLRYLVEGAEKKYRQRVECEVVGGGSLISAAHDVDGMDIRLSTWPGEFPTKRNYRHARQFVSMADVTRASRSGEELVALVRRAFDCALSQLFPPRIPFRIGTRSPKRLRIVEAR